MWKDLWAGRYYQRIDRVVLYLAGYMPDDTTIRRWCTEGVDGVVLQAMAYRNLRRVKPDWVLAFIHGLSKYDPWAELRRLDARPEWLDVSPYPFWTVDAAVKHVTGKTFDRMTLWRWWSKGADGTVLRTFRLGRRRLTTLAAVYDFEEAREAVRSLRRRAIDHSPAAIDSDLLQRNHHS